MDASSSSPLYYTTWFSVCELQKTDYSWAKLKVHITSVSRKMADDGNSFENNATEEEIENNAGFKTTSETKEYYFYCEARILPILDPRFKYICEKTKREPKIFEHLVVTGITPPVNGPSRTVAALMKEIRDVFDESFTHSKTSDKIVISKFEHILCLDTDRLIHLAARLLHRSFDDVNIIKSIQFNGLFNYDCVDKMTPVELLVFSGDKRHRNNLMCSINDRIDSRRLAFGFDPRKEEEWAFWDQHRRDVISSWCWFAVGDKLPPVVVDKITKNPCELPHHTSSGSLMTCISEEDKVYTSTKLLRKMAAAVDICYDMECLVVFGLYMSLKTEFVVYDINPKKTVYIYADSTATMFWLSAQLRENPHSESVKYKISNILNEPNQELYEALSQCECVAVIDVHMVELFQMLDFIENLKSCVSSGCKLVLCGLHTNPGNPAIFHEAYASYFSCRVSEERDRKPLALGGNGFLQQSNSSRPLEKFKAVPFYTIEDLASAVNEVLTGEFTLPVLFGSETDDEEIMHIFPDMEARRRLLKPHRTAVNKLTRNTMIIENLYTMSFQQYNTPRQTFLLDGPDIHLRKLMTYKVKNTDNNILRNIDMPIEPLAPHRIGSQSLQPFSHVLFINTKSHISETDNLILGQMCYKSLLVFHLPVYSMESPNHQNRQENLFNLVHFAVKTFPNKLKDIKL